MAAPLARFLRRLTAMIDEHGAPAIGRHQQQQLIDSGRVLLLFGAITVVVVMTGNAEEHLRVVLGLMLWLLGAALVMLSLAAPRFPRLAAAGAAIAVALRNYLLGGL